MTDSMLIPVVVIAVVVVAVLLLNRAEFRAVFRRRNTRPPRE